MKISLIIGAVLAVLFPVSNTAIAQSESAAPAAPKPCQADIYHAFDFWLGVWEVTGGNGAYAGDNKISAQESGCLLLEEWKSASGGTGQSYNFYDPGLKKWRQLWVSAGAVIDYAGELNEDGAMVLEGTINYHSGQSAPFRGTWTLNEDQTVTQYFQQFDPEKDVWNDWFTGTYNRKSAE